MVKRKKEQDYACSFFFVNFISLKNLNIMIFSIKPPKILKKECVILIMRKRGGEEIMHIKSKLYNKTLYVLLCGELDEHSATHVRMTLDNIFSNGNFNQIIIDLSELEFMDSTGIGVLIGRYKRMKNRNIPIFICNPSKHAEKIFKMTGLYEIMPKIV